MNHYKLVHHYYEGGRLTVCIVFPRIEPGSQIKPSLDLNQVIMDHELN